MAVAARLPTPGEQQAVSQSAHNAADSFSSLQGLFDQTNLVVVTPSAPAFSANTFTCMRTGP
jgi:hypothetical protein